MVSEPVLINKRQHTLLDKIQSISKILGVDSISNDDFKEYGLLLPCYDLTPIRVKCWKCLETKIKCKPFKNCKQVITHMYSPIHEIDEKNYPPLNDCIKLVYLISMMVQQKIIGDNV